MRHCGAFAVRRKRRQSDVFNPPCRCRAFLLEMAMSNESLLLLGRMGGMLKVLDEAQVVEMPDWMRAMLRDAIEQYEAFKESKHV